MPVILGDPEDPASLEIAKLAQKIVESKLDLKGKRLPLA
jgi:hypothetical protein